MQAFISLLIIVICTLLCLFVVARLSGSDLCVCGMNMLCVQVFNLLTNLFCHHRDTYRLIHFTWHLKTLKADDLMTEEFFCSGMSCLLKHLHHLHLVLIIKNRVPDIYVCLLWRRAVCLPLNCLSVTLRCSLQKLNNLHCSYTASGSNVLNI